jgi:hypothetical protein
LNPFEIEHRKPAELSHRDRKSHIDHTIHRAGQDRDFEFERRGVPARQAPGDVHFVGVNGNAAWDEGDFVETIGHACFAIPANPHSHA